MTSCISLISGRNSCCYNKHNEWEKSVATTQCTANSHFYLSVCCKNKKCWKYFSCLCCRTNHHIKSNTVYTVVTDPCLRCDEILETLWKNKLHTVMHKKRHQYTVNHPSLIFKFLNLFLPSSFMSGYKYISRENKGSFQLSGGYWHWALWPLGQKKCRTALSMQLNAFSH